MAEEVLNTIKVWLRLNLLTQDPNDYAPRVAIENSLNMDDIIQDIVVSRTDLSPATIRDVNTRIEEAILKRLANGYSVKTGIYYVYPKASGVFAKATSPFDPEIHSIDAQFTQNAIVRERLRASKVLVLGVAPVSMLIDEVVDKKTKSVNSALTPGHNVLISGNDIKIAGTEEGVGLRFINAETQAKVEISEDNIIRNTAKEVIILLPGGMPSGNYFLEITTQQSGATLLKQPRTSRFEHLLTVNAEP